MNPAGRALRRCPLAFPERTLQRFRIVNRHAAVWIEEITHATLATRSHLLSLPDNGHAGAARKAGLRSPAQTLTAPTVRTRWAESISTPHLPDTAVIVGQLDMPNVGDELHHFGWNACSACLCPYAPHPHVERRYLIVPGINSSRIHIVDTKPDPRKPQIVKVIEPETLAARTGYGDFRDRTRQL